MRALCTGLPAAAEAMGGGGQRESEMGHQVNTFKRGIYSPFYSKRFFISLVCVRNLQGVFEFHLGVVHTVRNGIKIHAIREKKCRI